MTEATAKRMLRGPDDARPDDWWLSCALAAITDASRGGVKITADTVRKYPLVAPSHPNYWGLAFKIASAQKIIRRCPGEWQVSSTPSRRGGVLGVWVGVQR